MILTLDWESAFGKHPETGETITLSTLTTEHYVRHPQFRAHGLGVKIDDAPTRYIYKRQELIKFIKEFPWDEAYVLAHHAHFDLAILSWRCKVKPKCVLDSMSMFRALYPHEPVGLDNMAKVLGLGEKGKELETVKDKWQLTDHEQQILGGYCINDVDLTYQSFLKMKSQIPVSEFQLIDHTVRLFTEPVIQINPIPLIEDFKREKRRKRALLKLCDATKEQLASNPTFAQILIDAEVDPPKKLSPSKVKDGRVDPDKVEGEAPLGLLPTFKAPKKPAKRGKTADEWRDENLAWEIERGEIRKAKDTYPWAYAFGKDDEKFKMLLDHPDKQVAALVEARMGVKSTIKETRSKRFYKIGKRGSFPVYMNYYGAHTGRLSGGDKQNAANLPRVVKGDPDSGALRKSWTAPPGHKFIVRDLGQIEARMLCYIAGQEDMLDVFRSGGDPYCHAASSVYGRVITEDDKAERAVGKIVVLGCGYQMGAGKLQESVRVGFMGMPGIIFDQSYVEQLGVSVEAASMRRSYKKGFAYLRDEWLDCKPLNVGEAEHLTHCAVTKFLVDGFRTANHKIVEFWQECKNALPYIMAGEEIALGKRGLITTCKNGLRMPNGMLIRYHELRLSTSDEKTFKYLSDARKHEWTKIYGGKKTENIVQALSRIVMMDQMMLVEKRMKRMPLLSGEILKVVSSTYDEIIAIAPDRLADQVYRMMGEEMGRAPEWCADLPLKSSGGYADNYGDCEK